MSTIVGIATAPGIGGIGIIRMSGEKTFEILDKIFIPKTKQDILDVLVNIEVTIDYPEYDTPEVQENDLKNMLNKVENKLEKLEKSFDNGKIIK